MGRRSYLYRAQCVIGGARVFAGNGQRPLNMPAQGKRGTSAALGLRQNRASSPNGAEQHADADDEGSVANIAIIDLHAMPAGVWLKVEPACCSGSSSSSYSYSIAHCEDEQE